MKLNRICLFLFSVLYVAAYAEENFCYLGEMSIVGDQSFLVEIVVSNSDTLAGFQIPFSYDYGNISVECDSVAFAGGACEDFSSQKTEIYSETNVVYLSAIQNVHATDYNDPLYPGTRIVRGRVPVI
jgi:hypothetical protein